ncbi:MAG: RelA/SpoT family protein [Bacteroidales bacterium]|jgi:GTP pyrophosphokinase|nr:RelA/SpoT family protein [Bacteroidales bacterium]
MNAESVEKQQILNKYKNLFKSLYDKTTKEQRKTVRKAFILAVNAHQNMRRKSGEPYIFHPLDVATIVSSEINLGTTSVVCALLHDVVEDTEIGIGEIRDIFGDKIALIIEGLTKIEDISYDSDTSLQAENFKKILIAMSEDIRVILLKLADRLHNMRTLEYMPEEKRLKISSETSFFYVPIAHRLGLYNIKSELEDCAMRYTDPIAYNQIAGKIESSKEERLKMINEFTEPIQQRLVQAGIKAEMSSRVKSVFSIYEKMKKKKIQFEDIYDIFAVRFTFDSEPDDENRICYTIADTVRKLYHTNPTRERDFLANPKPNGYQSLHVTAMSSCGKWIEVQIRSKRMDDISENGFAAHFKYKQDHKNPREYDNRVEDWLAKVKNILKNNDDDALNFLNEIKLNLNLKEIITFTPKGDSVVLPLKATILDFAYELHTNIGNQCIGAKVNYNIVSVEYVLKNGDQVEIITSKKQKPKVEWIEIVTTSKAKEAIKIAIREDQKKQTIAGMTVLKEMLNELQIEYNTHNIGTIQAGLKIGSIVEFWSFVAEGKLTKDRVINILRKNDSEVEIFQKKVVKGKNEKSLEELINEELITNPQIFMLDDTSNKIRHVVASCCNPLPGDPVVGFQLERDVMLIHRTSCPNAMEQMAEFGNRIIKAKWRKDKKIAFLSGIKIYGFDRKGMIKEIVDIISSQMDLNIKSLKIETQTSTFTGTIMLYIENVKSLELLIEKLQQIELVEKVWRIGYENE